MPAILKIDKGRVIQTIFHWYCPREKNERLSPHSHCLLRIFLAADKQHPVVIASQLYSNKGNTGIGRGYQDLATSVVREFDEVKLVLPNVVWLAHYGRFSEAKSYENLTTREVFCRIWLDFDNSLQAKEVDEQVLEQTQVQELLSGFEIEVVDEVLAKIDPK